MLMLPESPRYLLLKGRDADARRALGRLMTASPESPEVQEECVNILVALKYERDNASGSYLGKQSFILLSQL